MISETQAQAWGVFYPHPYKRKLMQECKSFEEACEERLNWSFHNEGDPDYFVDEITEDDRDIRMPLRKPIKDGVTLVGGQMEFPHLTAPQNKEYDIEKAQLWAHMINDGKRPTKWLTPNKKGTKVNFDFISSTEAREQAVGEFQEHLTDLNTIHGLDMKLRQA